MEPHAADGVVLMQMTMHTHAAWAHQERRLVAGLAPLAAQHTACSPWKVTRFMMFQRAFDLDEYLTPSVLYKSWCGRARAAR